MTLRLTSKYRDSRSRTSSESRVSDRLVKPTMSANRTETRRRSALAGAAAGAGAGAGAEAAGPLTCDVSAEPHSPQKSNWASFRAPQDGQTLARVAPQWPQNFRPVGLSVPHCGQTTDPPDPECRG